MRDPMQSRPYVEGLSKFTKEAIANHSRPGGDGIAKAHSPLESLALLGLMFANAFLDAALEELNEKAGGAKR